MGLKDEIRRAGDANGSTRCDACADQVSLIHGFIVSDHAERTPEFLRDCGEWVRTGRLKYREDIVDGLERSPDAFIGLLRGQNLGKLLVRVSADPTR